MRGSRGGYAGSVEEVSAACTHARSRDGSLHGLPFLMNVSDRSRRRSVNHRRATRRVATSDLESCRSDLGRKVTEGRQKPKAVMGLGAGRCRCRVPAPAVCCLSMAPYLHVLLACDGVHSSVTRPMAGKIRYRSLKSAVDLLSGTEGIFEASIRASLQLRGWAWLELAVGCTSTFQCSSLARLRQLSCSRSCRALHRLFSSIPRQIVARKRLLSAPNHRD